MVYDCTRALAGMSVIDSGRPALGVMLPSLNTTYEPLGFVLAAANRKAPAIMSPPMRSVWRSPMAVSNTSRSCHCRSVSSNTKLLEPTMACVERFGASTVTCGREKSLRAGGKYHRKVPNCTEAVFDARPSRSALR